MSREMLAAHNAVRARVGVPPLTWSPKLAAIASDWAERLVRRKTLIHRTGSGYGENLYAIGGSSETPAGVVEAWAAEAKDFDIESNRCRRVCGHYTQIVWKDTREVGCGVARMRGTEVWVCNYSPAGNWIGKKPY